jgi:multidrug efflux system membrane fusion protein
MKASRLTAVGLIAGAALWIGSGYFMPDDSTDSRAAVRPAATPEKLFRVAVATAEVTPHSRMLVLSGRTEADRKVTVMARTGGVITELPVRRGSRVKKGDIIAVLSDDAREAQVAQAQAMLTQRKTELEAKRKLIENGTLPKLDLVNLESQFKAAQAGLAAAEAERDRGVIRAPWSGVVTDVPVDIGQAAFSFSGQQIVQLMSLDPMLAVVEVAERQLSGIKVGESADIRLVTGETVTGKIRYVSKSASQTTRTYRVEVEIANADGKIPDGITAEVTVPLAAVPATRIPRSALTFSAGGVLGVRTVSNAGVVAFNPVKPLEDEQSLMWVAGIRNGTQIIVQGQDFVREGQHVQTVPVAGNAEVSAAQ